VTAAERAALIDLSNLGLGEVIPRSLKGEPYTFWDYRNGSFHRGWGMRIDLVYGNAAFKARVSDAYVDRDARKGKGASDHAPVVVDLT
jgi:exodeoxyribonuclease-3